MTIYIYMYIYIYVYLYVYLSACLLLGWIFRLSLSGKSSAFPLTNVRIFLQRVTNVCRLMYPPKKKLSQSQGDRWHRRKGHCSCQPRAGCFGSCPTLGDPFSDRTAPGVALGMCVCVCVCVCVMCGFCWHVWVGLEGSQKTPTYFCWFPQ